MGRYLHFGLWILVVMTVLGACQGQQSDELVVEGTTDMLQLQSDAFAAEGIVPQRFTCDGQDVSPPLSWSEPPAGTLSLVLICDDPDAPVGTWDHWVLFNIPVTTRSLPEGIPADPVVQGIGVHGSNSWQKLGYGGPCPPKGGAHRYYFKLYALDDSLDLDAGAGKNDVEKAMKGHILAEGQLMARYSR